MTGLSREEVKQRREAGLDNVRVDPNTRTVRQIVDSNIFTYFNLIFTVLGALLLIVGSFKDLTFLLIVLANTGIGIFQELRAKRTLDRLRLLSAKKVRVLREGRETESRTEDLVLDDVILLSAGQQIPADAVVLEGEIQVNEALLTGEQEEVEKTAGADLLSGSFVVSGACAARLTAVGRKSYISRLTAEATREQTEEHSEMIRSLDRLVKMIGIIIIPVGCVLFYQQYAVLGNSFRESVISMVAAVLGMVPEGLYMTASIAMVVSALRLAGKQVLVRNMRSIEALARVDVLCIDKTGTITTEDMEVRQISILSHDIEEDDLERRLGDICSQLPPDNATIRALQARFRKGGGEPALDRIFFSSRHKYSGVRFADATYLLGAPEYVLGDQYGAYAEAVQKMAMAGYRVVACAKTGGAEGEAGFSLREPICLCLLLNPVRPSSRSTFAFFAENGVEIKVLSGDNPVTAAKAAVDAGIPGGDHCCDCSHLVNERAIYDAIQRYTVFGRVTPEQKKLFVKALKRQGKTVGMTGDGVNDVLALREADCSIAMAGGSEAASRAAQLVLLDSDFSHMPAIVSEGRRVVNNLVKAASLYLTKNIFSLLLALFSMVSVLRYPLKPAQITLISVFTIGIPSFVLSLEPSRNRIKGKFLMNVFKMAAPAGITMFISVSALVVFGQVFQISDVCVSTSATMLVALVGFLFLGKVAQPFHSYHLLLLFSLIIGMGVCIIFMPSLFGIDSITRDAGMLLIVFLIATEGLFRYVHKLIDLLASLGGRKKGESL